MADGLVVKVDVARLTEVSATWATDGAMQFPGKPCLRWFAALGVPWPTDFPTDAITLPA